jgi:hypothetical protein
MKLTARAWPGAGKFFDIRGFGAESLTGWEIERRESAGQLGERTMADGIPPENQ